MDYHVTVTTTPEDDKALAHVYRVGGAQFAFDSVARSIVNSAREQLVRFERDAAASDGRLLIGDDDTIIRAAMAPDAETRHSQTLAKIEEERTEMERKQPLTARQLRLGLVSNGFALAQVEAAIDALPDGADKEKARIEWQYAGEFKRDHPLIATIAAQLGISAEQFETMWAEAQKL